MTFICMNWIWGDLFKYLCRWQLCFYKIAAFQLLELIAANHNVPQYLLLELALSLQTELIRRSDFLKVQINFLDFLDGFNLLKNYSLSGSYHEHMKTCFILCSFSRSFLNWAPRGFSCLIFYLKKLTFFPLLI